MKILRSTLFTLVLSAGSLSAADTLRVVATVPDLADIARQLGGDRIEVVTLAKGTENIHAVTLQPSHLVAVKRADLFLELGLSLEHSFVPGLLARARNRALAPGQPGFVNCSVGWQPLDVPAEVSRGRSADVHPEGNPHFNLDPRAGRHLAARILEGLIATDAEHAEAYRERHAAYLERLAEAEQRWAQLAPAFRGRALVSYHDDFDYFAAAYDLDVVGRIEAKPGVPPGPRDLAATVKLVRESGVDVLLTARWSNDRNVRFVAEQTGARVLELPVLVNGVAGADSWIAMMDTLHEELAAAFDEKVRAGEQR